MNEIDIYKNLKEKLNTIKKDIKHGWWITILWMFEALLALFTISVFPVAMHLTIWIPLSGVIVYLFLGMRKEYIFANKYPSFYNNWKDKSRFVNKVIERTNLRVQNDSTIKIDNSSSKYIDDLIDFYGNNKSKLSDALYNAINETNLVEEINFFEKVKKFKKDMNNCRSNILNEPLS